MKKLLLLLFSVLPLAVMAQVTLQPAIPAVGLVQKNQLWNVLAINSTNTVYECRLQLVLRDRSTGQEVMTAVTGVFTLSQGSRQLNTNILSPVQYNYLLAGFDTKMQGLLPAGLYTACYSLVTTTLKDANLAEECVQFDTEPLSPPILTYPLDSATLTAAPGQFTWIPPMPEGMFDRLQYDVIIVPVNQGQKAGEAIQENVPFFNEANHLNNVLNYSSSLPAFEKNKWYAWQVTARDGRDYAGKSETWVFNISTPPKNEDTLTANYIVLKNNGIKEGVYYVNDLTLHLKYYSFDRSRTSTVKVKRSNGTLIKELEFKTSYGDNQLNFRLPNSIGRNMVYIIETTSADGTKYTALISMLAPSSPE